ncbi:general substrate transporter [Xylariaceae sp. FL1019]|nr:general substrate transporter [Xylariaceae sp. FL1019]
MAGGGNVFTTRAAFSTASARLYFCCAVYALGSIFFGYDGASFGGVQAFTPFIRRFGVYNAAKHAYVLPTATKSLMNSLPLIGKFLGSFIVSPLTEKFGHKKTMLLTCCVQIIGPIIQVTSHSVPQFIVGRFLVYTAVGLVENVVPTYQSEIAPAALRGFFVGSIQLCLTFGSLIAGIVNNGVSQINNDSGWQIATALQLAPAVLIIALLYFTPDSPRWLLFNDRTEEALTELKKIRKKRDVDLGIPELEIAAMREYLEEGTKEKGSWVDLIRGTNRRRLGIACGIMIFQQLTGVTFSSSYGPTFYKQVGLGHNAYVYAVANNAVSVVTAFIAMILMDKFGRRTLCFHGGYTQGAFLVSVAALSLKSHPSATESNGVVAGMILYNAILHASLGPGAYITASEVGTQSLREKTMAVSTALNVVTSFIVVFITPYILASIGGGLAYIWAGFAFASSVWVWFFMPELKGKALEEIDQLFEAKIPAWRFHKHETTGLSHDVAVLESGKIQDKKLEAVEEIELAEVQKE